MWWQAWQELKLVFRLEGYWRLDEDPIFARILRWAWRRPVYIGLPLAIIFFIPIMAIEVAIVGLIIIFRKWGKPLYK